MMKTRALAGLVVLVSGIVLIGTTGIAFVLGWGLWAAGLTTLLSAVPSRQPAERLPSLAHPTA
jgi:hypothetical protein